MSADWLSVLVNAYFCEQPEVQPSSDPVSAADRLSVLANTYFDKQPKVQPSSDPVSGTSQNSPSGITRLLNASRSLTVASPVGSSLNSSRGS